MVLFTVKFPPKQEERDWWKQQPTSSRGTIQRGGIPREKTTSARGKNERENTCEDPHVPRGNRGGFSGDPNRFHHRFSSQGNEEITFCELKDGLSVSLKKSRFVKDNNQ
jgi:hypothetical protein